jgi:NodT family efflux transporter outer membrane factor (OMF) lipoprotein
MGARRYIGRGMLLAAVVAITVSLTACGMFKPLANAPPTPMPERWQANVAAETQSSAVWWKAFADPQLEALLDAVLRENTNVRTSALQLERARLQATYASRSRIQDFAIAANAGASKTSDAGIVARSSGVSAAVSYEVDLWDRLKNERDAASWEATASAADRRAVLLTEIGNAASLHWQLAFVNEAITNAQADISNAMRTLVLVNSRYRAGYVSGLDVSQAEAALTAQRVRLSALMQQRVVARHDLSLLLARAPAADIATELPRLPVSSVLAIAAGLPAELLARRPDVAAAESRLRATLASVNAERAGFYPAFTLTSKFGTSSDALAGLFRNPIASIGASLVLPALEWNKTKLTLQLSESRYEEAVLNFKQRLYGALREVEDTLSARMQLAEEAKQLAEALTLAQRSEKISQTRFLAGATDAQPWLNAQQAARVAQLDITQNRLNQLNNHVKLVKALGGDPEVK